MAKKPSSPAKVLLKNVRLSYPALFRAKSVNDGEPRFSASFILDPKTKSGKANIEKVEDAIDYVIEQQWPKKAPKFAQEKLCLREGNKREVVREGYEDMWYVSASNKKKPLTVDFDKEEVTDADNVLYAGCYVDALIRVWPQDHPKYGKRVNASLEIVRFRADGDAFGAEPPSVDDLDDDDEDEAPRKKSSRRSRDDDEDEAPRKKRRSRDEDEDDEDDEDEASRRKSRRARDEDEDEDEAPRKRRSRDDDEDDDEDRPSRKSRSRRRSSDDDEDDVG